MLQQMNTSRSIRKYGVVGLPVRQSLSPWLHAHFSRRTQRAVAYAAYAPPPESFAAFADDFFASGGCGLNITAPYKQAALQFAGRASTFARRADAANVLTHEGRRNVADASGDTVLACNTDGAGLLRDLTRHCGMSVAGQKILIIGAGGAARSAALALADHGAVLVIAARRISAAESLAKTAQCDFVELSTCGGGYDIVINATSVGHAGESPLVPAAALHNLLLAYDLNYGAAASVFLRAASSARTRADGSGMLVEQAALSFAVWEGIMPSTAELVAALRQHHNRLWE